MHHTLRHTYALSLCMLGALLACHAGQAPRVEPHVAHADGSPMAVSLSDAGAASAVTPQTRVTKAKVATRGVWLSDEKEFAAIRQLAMRHACQSLFSWDLDWEGGPEDENNLNERIRELLDPCLGSRARDPATWSLLIKATGSYAITVAPDEIQDNEVVARAAIGDDARALGFLSARLRDSAEIVGMAVVKDGLMLKAASKRLRGDLEIARMAIANNAWAIRYAAEALHDNEDLVKLAVQQQGLALQALQKWAGDENIVRLAVAQDDGHSGMPPTA